MSPQYLTVVAGSCPYCGGDLIHDYERGEVVCSNCGAVIDVIYESTQPHPPEPTQPRRKAEAGIPGLREIKQLEEELRVCGKKRLSEVAVSKLPPDVKRVAEEGVKIAHKLSPALTCGKTLRAKYAVGYIAHKLISGGEVDTEFIKKTFCLSRSSVKRLVSSVRAHVPRN